MINGLLIIYLKTFYVFRFLLVSLLFNIMFFYYCNGHIQQANLDVSNLLRLTYHGTLFNSDFMGGVMWISHYIILFYFIGVLIEDQFNSKLTSILTRVSRVKWYISYIIFFVLISMTYLIIQFSIFIVLFRLHNQSWLNNNIVVLDLISLGTVILLSFTIYTLIFFILLMYFKPKFSYQLVVTLLLSEAYFIGDEYLQYFPGLIGMLKTLENHTNVIYFSIFYLFVFVISGSYICRLKNITQNPY